MALIRQVVESTTSGAVTTLVEATFKRHELRGTQPSLTDLTTLLQGILKEFKERFLSVDGLDEMLPERQTELLDIILSLEAKVVIMSRPLALLKTRLEKQKAQKAVFIDIMASSADLDIFITHMIDITPGFGDLLDEHGIREEIIEKIKQKAGGM